jgi:hypothetical protein
MDYKIDEKNRRISIYGTPDEIRLWFYCLDDSVKPMSLADEFKPQLDNLENLTEQIQVNFTRVFRIMLDKNSIESRVNAPSVQSEFYWSMIKDYFEEAKKLYEERTSA